jgi:hypothetical protein
LRNELLGVVNITIELFGGIGAGGSTDSRQAVTVWRRNKRAAN